MTSYDEKWGYGELRHKLKARFGNYTAMCHFVGSELPESLSNKDTGPKRISAVLAGAPDATPEELEALNRCALVHVNERNATMIKLKKLIAAGTQDADAQAFLESLLRILI